MLAVGAAVGLAMPAAPASAAITAVSASCPASGVDGPCTESYVYVSTTDSNPVWITLNGNTLGTGAFTPTANGAGGYSLQLWLDCLYTPFHVVATEKDANGTTISQGSADFTPKYNWMGAILGDLTTGSLGAGVQGFYNGSSNGVAPGLATNGSSNAAATGSSVLNGCHVVG
ncbi:hypothetical protein GCM10027167_23080 [Nocardia heshunensis]